MRAAAVTALVVKSDLVIYVVYQYFLMVLSKQGLIRSSLEDSSRGMSSNIFSSLQRRNFTAELAQSVAVVWCSEGHVHML